MAEDGAQRRPQAVRAPKARLDHLPAHPMDRVNWTTPKADDEIDQRVVINPQQAVGLLKAVEDTDPAMVGFFACMYYAALRPGEVVHRRKENCILPEAGWGKLMLGGSTQYSGAWGDNGQVREDRALKHRSARSVRPVPACPQLVRILRHHLDTYTCGPDGRLFVTRTGRQRHPVSGGYAGPVSGSSYGNTWRTARAAALTTAEAASPLARRPYDLRHACVSLWLNAGVPATQWPNGPGTAWPCCCGCTRSASPARRTAPASGSTPRSELSHCLATESRRCPDGAGRSRVTQEGPRPHCRWSGAFIVST